MGKCMVFQGEQVKDLETVSRCAPMLPRPSPGGRALFRVTKKHVWQS